MQGRTWGAAGGGGEATGAAGGSRGHGHWKEVWPREAGWEGEARVLRAGAGLRATLAHLDSGRTWRWGLGMAQPDPAAPSGWHFDAKVFAKLLQKHKREHGVWHEADASRQEPLVKGQWPELCSLHGAVENTLILALGVH